MSRRLPASVLLAACLLAAAPAGANDRVHPLFRIAQADDPPPRAPARAVQPEPVRPAPDDDTPVYKTWWFWGLTAVVVGGVVVLAAATAGEKDARPARPCSPDFVACFGDGR